MKNLKLGGIYTNSFEHIYIILEETDIKYYFFLINEEMIEKSNQEINNYLLTRLEYDQRLELISTDILPFIYSVAKNGNTITSINGYLGLVDEKILKTLKIYLNY